MTGNSAPPDPAIYTATILAAGASRRMGTPKALLRPPAGGPTLFEEAVAAALHPRLEIRVAVTREELLPLLTGAKALTALVINRDPDTGGQLSSLRLALRFFEQCPGPIAGTLVLLVDNPGRLVQRTALVVEAALRQPAAVLAAAFEGRTGHPLWLPRRLWPGVHAWTGPDGLRGFLSHAGEPITPVDTAIPEALADIDTPEEWRTSGS